MVVFFLERKIYLGHFFITKMWKSYTYIYIQMHTLYMYIIHYKHTCLYVCIYIYIFYIFHNPSFYLQLLWFWLLILQIYFCLHYTWILFIFLNYLFFRVVFDSQPNREEGIEIFYIIPAPTYAKLPLLLISSTRVIHITKWWTYIDIS